MFEFGKWVLLNLEFTIILIIAILLWLFSSKPFYCESYDFFLVFQIHCITWSNFFHNQMLNISAKDIIRKEDITPANQLLRDEQIKKDTDAFKGTYGSFWSTSAVAGAPSQIRVMWYMSGL